MLQYMLCSIIKIFSETKKILLDFQKQENLFKVSYLIICFLISIPIIYGIWNFIYSSEVPSGGDPADHTLYILNILKTGKPLIQYSQFSVALSSDELVGLGYYPSLLHNIIAVLTIVITGSISFVSVLNTIKAFMLIQYLIGIGAYALLIKTIIDSVLPNKHQNHSFNSMIFYYGLLILAFGLFVYSTPPIIKTFRDGGYGEIFSMWCIFPFYIYALIQRRFIISAILLAIIASTHNLSFIMTLAATLPFFALLLICKDFNTLRKSKDFLLVFLVLFLPALIFFYAPTASLAYQRGTGEANPWTIDQTIEVIKPNLYYAGLISSIMILIFNYRKLGWLAGWGALYHPIIISPIFAERFARELSLPFGLVVGIAVSIGIYKLFSLVSSHSNNKMGSNSRNLYQIVFEFIVKRSGLVVIPIVIIILSLSYLYFADRFELYSDPITLLYYNKAFGEAHAYLASLDISGFENTEQNRSKPAIVVFGVDPWLSPAIYDRMRVLEVVSEEEEQSFSSADRRINKELRLILEDPNSEEARNIIIKYNIRYVVISDVLPGRWYPDSYLRLDAQLDKYYMDTITSYAQLLNTFSSEGIQIRIYFIDYDKLKGS